MTPPSPAAPRLDVTKTYKLFIDGKLPRSESGRTVALQDSAGKVVAHASRASRKDLRDAVTAARKALPGWRNATAYLRGQILYRMAEMLEGRRAEFESLIANGKKPAKSAPRAPSEFDAAVDRLVCFAGWADKYQQVLGCNNPVAGPYYNFTVPEPTGVIGAVCPDQPPLLGLVSLIAPVIAAGNTVVVVGGEGTPAVLVAAVLAEVSATSDIPPGVVNLLTGIRDELVPAISTHRDIDGVLAAGVSKEQAKILRSGAAENLKRVCIREVEDWFDPAECQGPDWIERVVEMKTIWHPSAT